MRDADITTLFALQGDEWCQRYLTVRDSDDLVAANVRERVDGLWNIYKPYADYNFADQFGRHIDQRFWEMYLACTFLNLGYELMPRPGGPDICTSHQNRRVWIEAIAPTPGQADHPDRVPALETDDAGWVPEQKIIMRYTAAVREKKARFNDYENRRLIEPGDICIIAVSGASMQLWGSGADDVPYIVQAVYPIGKFYVRISPDTRKVVETGHQYRPAIPKSSGASVSTTAFLDARYRRIGGLIFSVSNLWNFPENFGRDFITLHNFRADNPIPRGVVKRGREYWLVDKGDRFELGSKTWAG